MDVSGLAGRIPSLAGRIPGNPVGRVADGAFLIRVLANAGAFAPVRPDRAGRMLLTYVRWGRNPATALTLSSIGHPDERFLADELGDLSFAEGESRANSLARALAQRGVRQGDGIALMARNHRWFVDVALASAKLGCNTIFLNTMFSGPQLADVVEREAPRTLVYDQEFSGLLEGMGTDVRRYVAWHEGDDELADGSIADLIESTRDDPVDPPDETPGFVILTSGTTGTPRGAQRRPPSGLAPLAALIDAIPYRSRERMMIAAPLFHSWGFLHLIIGLTLSNSIVLRRKFDPQGTLDAVERSDAQTLAVVPVMLQRILALGDEALEAFSLPSLRVTAVSGSALPGELATEWMDRYGDSVYNLYGSTEVAYASVASPADLRRAPGTAGRPPHGTTVRIVDERGEDVAPGRTGRIFVGNEMAFEGYTGGGGKEALEELFSSGDVGHFDDDGLLFIDGRDDEMIVSGGENVFPREIEDLLAGHPAVREVAVIGVDDEEFGQRLKAFVVVTESGELSEHDAKAYVKANLAGYKSPREIVFCDSLPRNATGKILKRELA
ncbi:MAG: AMP-binding protein [Solirubrobacterales bacterium]|nr:AMP-binding protein [Solirubrobacterales bacterium]